MVPRVLILATRFSRLALAQTEEALRPLRAALPETAFVIRPMSSPGDRDLRTPLTDPDIADDFFTRDLDEALLDGHADLAIHSAKDLPDQLRPSLTVAARLPARETRDALVLRKGWPAKQAPRIIGASSPSREQQMRDQYPNAVIKPIRGSIDERLAQLDAGQYDAVVMAACALDRLGLTDRISAYLAYPPTPGQGQLAIVGRSNADALIKAIRPLETWTRSSENDRTVVAHDYTLFVGTDPRAFHAYAPMIHWPVIELISRPLQERVRIINKRLDHVDGVLFASRQAVHSFMEALRVSDKRDASAMKNLLVVGPSTHRALREYGPRATCAEDAYDGFEALIHRTDSYKTGRYLYPCSNVAPIAQRTHTGAAAGLFLCAECFYGNRPAPLQDLPALRFSRVLFTSRSVVRAYFERYPTERDAARTWLALGPPTAEAVSEMGLPSCPLNLGG